MSFICFPILPKLHGPSVLRRDIVIVSKDDKMIEYAS